MEEKEKQEIRETLIKNYAYPMSFGYSNYGNYVSLCFSRRRKAMGFIHFLPGAPVNNNYWRWVYGKSSFAKRKGGKEMKDNDEKECTIILNTLMPNDFEVKKVFKKKYGKAKIISWAICDGGNHQAGTTAIKVKYVKGKVKSNKAKSNKDKGCLWGVIILLGYIAIVATVIIASFIFIFTVNLWWTKLLIVLLFVVSIIVGVFVIPIKVIIGIINTDVEK